MKKRFLFYKSTISVAIMAIAMLLVTPLDSKAQRMRTVTASKEYVTRTINISHFDEMEVEGYAEIEHTITSAAPTAEIYCPQNLYEEMEIMTKGNKLIIRRKHKNTQFRGNYKLQITTSGAALSKISLAGSSRVTLVGENRSNNLSISIAGSGKCNFDAAYCSKFAASIAGSGKVIANEVNANSANVSIAGSGQAELGTVNGKTFVSAVSGSGRITVQEVKSAQSESSVAGSGRIAIGEVMAEEKGSCRVSGSGRIDIGTMTTVETTVQVSGSGRIGLSGNTDTASYAISGSGRIDAARMIANRVGVSIAGSGVLDCHANDAINAKGSGSGRVNLSGSPSTLISEKISLRRVN